MGWEDAVPETLTIAGDGGSMVPVRAHPFLKESPDLGHFVMKAMNLHQEVGRRVPVKKLEKPEEVETWRKENLPKFYEAGLLARPPADPKEYGIKKPDSPAAGLVWNEERGGKFASILHKHGAPVALANELMTLHTEALMEGVKSLETSREKGIAALKQEFGAEYDARVEQVKRFTPMIFKTPEETKFFTDFGLADHPTFLSVMMRLAPAIAADSSIIPQGGGGGGAPQMTGEQVKAELVDISTNDKNPRHAGYLRGDPEVHAYIDALYKKAYGTGTVTI